MEVHDPGRARMLRRLMARAMASLGLHHCSAQRRHTCRRWCLRRRMTVARGLDPYLVPTMEGTGRGAAFEIVWRPGVDGSAAG
jgi:hypothetical protein